VRGKHRYRRPPRTGWIHAAEWRRPLSAIALLLFGLLLVVTGLLIGDLLIVWALLGVAALVGAVILLTGDSGPEWPDWPMGDHSPYR